MDSMKEIHTRHRFHSEDYCLQITASSKKEKKRKHNKKNKKEEGWWYYSESSFHTCLVCAVVSPVVATVAIRKVVQGILGSAVH
jgi:hypothetical protein